MSEVLSPLDAIAEMVEAGNEDDITPAHVLAAAEQAHSLLGEAISRSATLFNLLGGLLSEYTELTQKEEA